MTTSSTAGTGKVDLRNPGQLLAAIPHLLGFRPSESVLVIGHRGANGDRIGNVLRADLPPPGEDAALAVRLRTPMLYDDTVGVTIVIVGGAERGGGSSTGPPREGLVEAITNTFAEVDLCVMHALWTPEISAGTRWGCYQDSTCTGRLPDPDSTVIAAVTAHAGLVTFGSREAMERQLAPADPAALTRRSALLDAAADDWPTPPGKPADHSAPVDPVEHGRAVVRAALARAERGELSFSDRDVVELALALDCAEVRDACLATALPPACPRAATAERLWLTLIREIPAPERAQVATLLGYSAYVRGEGALAGMAIANAREADPGHVLAQLLAQALEHALPPETLAGLGASTGIDPLWEDAEQCPHDPG